MSGFKSLSKDFYSCLGIAFISTHLVDELITTQGNTIKIFFKVCEVLDVVFD